MARPKGPPTRRAFWLGLAGLGLAVPVWSGEGGGGRDAGSQQAGRLTFLPQDSFLRMTKDEFRARQQEAKEDGTVLTVEGFREGMTGHLYDMKRSDPRSLRRLMKDLGKLPKRKDRIARIDQEIREQTRRAKIYQEGFESGRGSLDKAERAAARDDGIRYSRTQTFLEQLRKWKRRPMEGTYQ